MLFVNTTLTFKEIEIFNNLFLISLCLIFLFAIVIDIVTTSSIIIRFLSLFLLFILIA